MAVAVAAAAADGLFFPVASSVRKRSVSAPNKRSRAQPQVFAVTTPPHPRVFKTATPVSPVTARRRRTSRDVADEGITFAPERTDRLRHRDPSPVKSAPAALWIDVAKRTARASGFFVGARVGCGGFSEVWELRSTRASMRRRFAGKFFLCSDADPDKEELRVGHFVRELRAQLLLSAYKRRCKDASVCPGLAGLYDCFTTPTGAEPDVRCIVTELGEGGDLADFLIARGCISENVCKKLAHGLFTALATLHDCRIVHADIKLENIYLLCACSLEDIILGDFGLSDHTPDDDPGTPLDARATPVSPAVDHVFRGTYYAAAPEVVRGTSRPLYESDVWCAALVCLSALVGYNPFYIPEFKSDPPLSPRQILNAVGTKHDRARDLVLEALETAHCTAAASDFFLTLLDWSPYARPSAAACLQFEWITSGFMKK